jgi:peroxiredoxin
MKTIAALLLCALGLFAAEGPRRAPGFSLADSKGQLFDLADFRGKIVVLEFLKTDCPHCAPFASVLGQIQQKYGAKIAIIGVVNLREDNPTTVAKYISGHGVNYPILLDQGQMAYSYVRSGTLNFPHVYLIDANGMIQRDLPYGPLTRDIYEGNGLSREIDRLLGVKK